MCISNTHKNKYIKGMQPPAAAVSLLNVFTYGENDERILEI